MKVRTLFVVMGLGLLLAGGVRAADEQPKTAGDTVKKIFELMKAGNAKEAAKFFAGEDMTEGLERGVEAFKSGEIAATLADSKEDGDLAAVIVKATMKREGQERTRYESNVMMRKNGMWQIYQDAASMKLDDAAKAKMEALTKWATERRAELNKTIEKASEPK